MFHHLLRSVALLATVVSSLGVHAEPALSASLAQCARGPTLYAAGELKLAFRTFFACAIAGHAPSQYSAAMMMRSGESNEEQFPNPYGARVFLEQSATQGYVQAIYALGKEHELGGPAYQRSPRRATELFQQAALHGHVDAQVDMGTLYFLGRGGVMQDDAIAARWYEQAASAGHWGAQFLIASMYEHGNGVRRDELAALRWYEQAQSGGDEVAPLKAEHLRLTIATRTRRLRLN